MSAAAQWTPVDETAAKWTPVEEGATSSADLDKQLHAAYDARPLWRKVLGLEPSDLSPELKQYRDQLMQKAQQQIASLLEAGASGAKQGAIAGAKMVPFMALPELGAAAEGLAGAGRLGLAANAAAQGAGGAAITAAEGGSGKQAALAGGLSAAGPLAAKIIPKALLLGRTPEEAYQSALKPSTTLSAAERGKLVQTGLEEKIPVSKEGLEDIAGRIDALNDKIKQTVAQNPSRPINPAKAVGNLRDVETKFAAQVNPKSDLQAIDAAKQEFLDQLRSTPGGAVRNMTAAEAQAMKQGTYRALGSKAYGELKGASVEAQKALARGLKEEIARQFPEIAQLNARESKLLDLEPVLERAVNRISNHQLIGIGTPVAAGATKAVTGSGGAGAVAGVLKAVLDNPNVKSRLAIALSRSGVPLAQALQRLGAYSAALASAAESQSPQP